MRPSRNPPFAYPVQRLRRVRAAARLIDGAERELWGAGPWGDEPDRVEWSSQGFACVIARALGTGTLNGYVGVRTDHPWWHLHRDVIPAVIHGGLTYAGRVEPLAWHLPKRRERLWWVGFDCAHAYDGIPILIGLRTARGGRFDCLPGVEAYRDLEYVTNEVGMLALQARQAAEGATNGGRR